MGNLKISTTPAVPAADGTGAPSSVAAMGGEKTIIVDGAFSGAVQIEGNCGGGFVTLATFTAPGQKTLEVALNEVRVVRVGTAAAAPGAPEVTVQGNNDGAQFTNLPLGGASTDVSALGTFNTIIVDGVVGGAVNIEISQDGVDWTHLTTFRAAGHKSLNFVADFMRVNHVAAAGSNPVVSVGAVNSDTADKPQVTLAPAANVGVDAFLGAGFEIELDQNLTLDNPINVEPGNVIEIAIRQGAGGNTVAYGGAYLWPGGIPPVITAGAAAEDKIRCYVRAVDASNVATVMLCEFAQAFA